MRKEGSVAPPEGRSQARHFNQIDLSRRWKISPRTLERWRWLNQGPRYLKVGGRVLYRLIDIEAYEAEHLYLSSEPAVPAQRAQHDERT